MNELDMNTKQHERVILLNINSQSMKERDMNVTSMNIKPQIRIIQENIKKSKQEGVRCECRYECDKCEWKNHLTNHIKSKHEEVRYECDQCEYKVTLQS